jgi:hypothetical protein
VLRRWSESKIGWFCDRLNWRYAVMKARREYWAARGAWIDFRLGGSTYISENSRYRHLGVTAVESINYENLAALMCQVPVRREDVLVDVGCATGRVINWWLTLGLKNRIVGVELDVQIAARTKQRLARHTNVEIIAGDAVELTPADATLCYLYNPFDGDVLLRWISNMLARRKARPLRVIYVNPTGLEAFSSAGKWSITMTSIPWHQVALCDLVTAR